MSFIKSAWYTFQKALELGLGLLGVGSSLYPLVDFHIGNDADGNALWSQAIKKL